MNINKTPSAFTIITFTKQKLNKNKIRLFHSFLIIFFSCPFSSITPSYFTPLGHLMEEILDGQFIFWKHWCSFQSTRATCHFSLNFCFKIFNNFQGIGSTFYFEVLASVSASASASEGTRHKFSVSCPADHFCLSTNVLDSNPADHYIIKKGREKNHFRFKKSATWVAWVALYLKSRFKINKKGRKNRVPPLSLSPFKRRFTEGWPQEDTRRKLSVSCPADHCWKNLNVSKHSNPNPGFVPSLASASV